MGFLDRILTILNEIVILLWQIFKHTIYISIPRPFKRLFKRLSFIWVWFKHGPLRLVQLILGFIVFLSVAIARPFIRFEKAFQEVAGELVEQVRGIQVKDLTFKKIAQKFFQIFVTLFSGVLYVWKMTWGNMPARTIVAICSLAGICLLAGWQIYNIGDKLVLQLVYGGRKPASAFEQQSTLKRRPVYYKQDARHYDLKQMRIPVYIESEHSIKIFEVDVTIESSNRYVRRFFSENENLIRDKMLSTTEPVIHAFPFSEEGKHVIKEKITSELNKFIKENGMEGEVANVYFNAIVAI